MSHSRHLHETEGQEDIERLHSRSDDPNRRRQPRTSLHLHRRYVCHTWTMVRSSHIASEKAKILNLLNYIFNYIFQQFYT